MHIPKPYERSVTLFASDGQAYPYSSLAAARKALGIEFIRERVARDFHTFVGCYYVDARFIMRDDFGEPVTAADFERPVRWTCRVWRSGYKTPAGSHYLRRIRTFPEIRMNSAFFPEEGEPRPRARRTNMHLSTDQLERRVASQKEFSWKRQSRRTRQWK